MHSIDHNLNEIALDHISLAKEESLISQTHFLSAYCDAYWDKCYIFLKKSSEIEGQYGSISCNMLVIYFRMHRDLRVLSANHENNEAFITLMSRKVKHDNEEQNCACNELT